VNKLNVANFWKDGLAKMFSETNVELIEPEPKQKALVQKNTVVVWNGEKHETTAKKIAKAFNVQSRKLNPAERQVFSSADILIIIGSTAKL